MNNQKYQKSITLLDKAESKHSYNAILLQMDLSAHMAGLPLITSVVFDALDKAREVSKL